MSLSRCLQREYIPRNLQHLPLADPTYHTPGNIDMLLGVDIYTDILMNGVIKGEPGTPIAQQTHLGWILSGGLLEDSPREIKSLHLNISLEKMVEKFWEAERLESEENEALTPPEQRAEKIYQETLSRDPTGRYIVALPFKSDNPTLPENSREIAFKRFMNTERKLTTNPKLREAYNQIMREYITLQYMELVKREEPMREREKRVYLPFHAVVREDRETTKVRIVYDLSCKGTNGVSLNDELLVSTSLLSELRDILMRWRMHRVCFVADIIKMYLQIMVRREDTDFQRIFWRFSPEEDLREYRLLTVIFGTACAPFLALRTLKQVAIDEASTEEYDHARDIIQNSFYMDDVLSGGDTEEIAIEAKRQLTEVLRRGGFKLQKWASNNKTFMNTVEPEKRAKNAEIGINSKETIKTLGIAWQSSEDTLLIMNNVNTLPNERVTKRTVLTVIASLFDPMGWLAPSVVMAKIFMQKLWAKRLSWDEELPETLKVEWMKFCKGIKELSEIKLERWIGTVNTNQQVELHGFADASMAAYAGVVYCRVIQSDGRVRVSLVIARTKVAPLKELTLPRLELSAALLLSQLLKRTATAMRIESKNTYAWTDSKVTLAWILGDPLKWTPFVKNRVIAINNHIDTTWSYVNTKENPADPASRGVSPEKLNESTLWFNGPAFLQQKEWKNETGKLVEDTELEMRKMFKCATTVKGKEESFIITLANRYSSLRKLVDVIAYCRRWVNLKEKRNLPTFVTHEEREEALTICIRLSQHLEFPEEVEALTNRRPLKKGSRLLSLTPFLDDKGVLRVGGRLKHADLEFLSKHPVIISKRNALIQMLLHDAHKKTLHGGPQLMTTYLRGRYWLIDAGNTVKGYVRNCFPCAKQKAKTITQLMGDLPETRVKPSRPFYISGVDFAGPVNVRMSPGRGSKSFKAYISIFICMSTKAIHIECVSDMTMEAFMAAFKRFTSRRGFVKEMWSDHGTNFVAASKELLETWRIGQRSIPVELAALLDTKGTQWKFIPPGSPNHGGLWEAGVKSIKFHLKRTIGDATPTFEELNTLLTQIEACLNSRPLSPLSDHPDDLEPLTPSHFLVGEPLITIPERDFTEHKKLPYPKAVGFIVTNELCERFSFYGMKAILSLYLRDKLGYSDNGATIIYHVFTMFAYFFPLLGAMIADGWLGRFRTILYLSMVYALGSVLISVTAMPPVHIPQLEFTIIALLLIAFGTGGIKPCVSAFGGDQFKLPEQEKYLGYFFSLFYAAINAGSLVSTFLTPILRADVHCFGDNDCYSLAFGVPGVLMIVSVVIFVAGRRLYVVKNPAGNIIGQVGSCIGHAIVKSAKSKEKREHWLDYAQDKFGPALVEDVKGLLRVLVLFTPVPIFWALFDQQGSRWTFQADRMRQDIGNWELKADQMQVLNPLLILIFIPIFQVVIYPFMTWCKLISKPLHKMIWGGLLAAGAFVISGIVELNLLPTYGTPLSAGLAQLRVYNGFDCNLTLHILGENAAGEFLIPSLYAYEKLDIATDGVIELPYELQGNANTVCASVNYKGTFNLKEKTANSFFVSNEGVYNFMDDIEKVVGGVAVRFLSNIRGIEQISIMDTKKNRTKLMLQSSDKEKKIIDRGMFDVVVAGQPALANYSFQTGGVYTINLYEDSNGVYAAKSVTITPANSVHILWLVPQYVVITMAEVMFSVTGLEFSFTQAPASMKSVLQAVWLLTVAIGNLIVVLIVEGNFLDAQWKEFFLFAGLMVLDMLVFTAMAFRYKYAELRSSSEDLAVEEIKIPSKPDLNKDNKLN